MKVTVVCFGAMREYLPADAHENRAEITLSDEATVGDLVDQMGAPQRLASSILVGESREDLAFALTDGMQVTLMPPFTGG
jgi:molybdopterin converting factor small subunit